MDTPLVLSRAWYVLVGLAALAYALGSLIGPMLNGCRVSFDDPAVLPPTGPACTQLVDAPIVAMVTAAGLLSLSAAGWVRSGETVRGMLASIGIAVGALTAIVPVALFAAVMSYYDAIPGPAEVVLVVLPAIVGISAGIIMWRRSARPWDRTSSV